MNHQALSSFIWSVADLLRGDYKQSEYGKVSLHEIDEELKGVTANIMRMLEGLAE